MAAFGPTRTTVVRKLCANDSRLKLPTSAEGAIRPPQPRARSACCVGTTRATAGVMGAVMLHEFREHVAETNPSIVLCTMDVWFGP
jgi:hypothetical protein